ncbi:Aldo/keto reductase [Xylariomycetidae sp. FL0641]|nr:Aldo/keto reductase [Xylariomycetidae sp. FL0641]
MKLEPAAMPRLLYGTAWKGDATANLVLAALKAGFRGLDTAAQPLHYREDLVGDGVRAAVAAGVVGREDIFIQTKFVHVDCQDPENMPYDGKACLEEQVHASVASSLQNLGLDRSDEAYIDSLLLHRPLDTAFDTMTAWKTLESYVPHRIRQLGLSNTNLGTLDLLCASPEVTVRPACVQNAFTSPWEAVLRLYCRPKSIVFQAFRTLKTSKNVQLLQSQAVVRLAESTGVERAVALYALVLGLRGVAILDGTTNEQRMVQDLEAAEIVDVFAQGEEGRAVWSKCLEELKTLIGEMES